ncbi:phage repressor protein CI [Rahnella inusitata]|uniref:phage repressor protein CI n=1 Tax=Rahnella inusitata TaxID=58169 RepID=UPI001BC82E1F|nr:phage repressor protein CI [Rahnella inusitata]QUT16145.1 phage repressor protein CI [Rahnella inusitata]
MNLQIDLDKNSPDVLDRVIEAYGFNTKLALANHLGMASSSLAARYKRGLFPADIVVRCMAETDVTLEWLVSGKGKKYDDGKLDVMKFSRKKLVDGELFESGYLMFDKVMFLPGVPLPTSPICVLDEKTQYIVDQKFADVYDGQWIVNIEGKVSVRTLTRIPIHKVRVSGVGMAFDCSIDDIEIIGRVVMTCSNG